MLVDAVLVLLALLAGWVLRGLYDTRNRSQVSCSCGEVVMARGPAEMVDRMRQDFLEDHDGPGHEVVVWP